MNCLSIFLFRVAEQLFILVAGAKCDGAKCFINCPSLLLFRVVELSGGTYSSVVRLPGTKLREHEKPKDAAERMLREFLVDLGDAAEGMELCEHEGSTTEWSPSPTYDLQTQYRRMTFRVYQEVYVPEIPPHLGGLTAMRHRESATFHKIPN